MLENPEKLGLVFGIPEPEKSGSGISGIPKPVNNPIG